MAPLAQQRWRNHNHHLDRDRKFLALTKWRCGRQASDVELEELTEAQELNFAIPKGRLQHPQPWRLAVKTSASKGNFYPAK